MSKSSRALRAAETFPEEQWRIVQVASFMQLTYQTARNQILSGMFGRSEYDPMTRVLTVSSSVVRQVAKRRRQAQKLSKR